MNLAQKQIVEFIKSAINAEKRNVNINEQIDWKEIIDLSREHKVEALVYSALSNEIKESILSELLNSWKKEVFMSGVTQQRHMKEMENVLKEFNKGNIDVLVLKGLVIRDLYPSPTLRTMSDADIVIKEEDLEKSKEVLTKIGYIEYKQTPNDFMFIKSGCLPIELHWDLADDHFFKQISKFEEDMWPNILPVNIGEAHANEMGLEDLAIFQCIHMAKHIVYRGFGIRHLIDFALLVNKRGNEIDWFNFLDRCKKYGIYKFVLQVMLVCNELFDMVIPRQIESIVDNDNSYLNEFIRDIFESGVHGKKDFVSSMAYNFAHTDNEDNGKNKSPFKKYMNFLFPKVETMSDTYNYAKKYKVLHPVAWGHHLVRGVFNKDYSINEKIKFTTETVTISQKRKDLINWLEL